MSAPASITGKYQLVILGQAGNSDVATNATRLMAAVSSGISLLGVNPKKFLVGVGSAISSAVIDPKMPAVGVFFGFAAKPALTPEDGVKLANLVADGNLIIPVVENLSHFSANVPVELTGMNGCVLADCGADLERLAARVLEGFGLLRERRRLFISYRRAESTGVASQLYEALDHAGFDVFLDTQGAIRPGEHFQEILWHRLADTDVAVLLDTPDFLASRWTEEELARANTSNIQILQILWPERTEISSAAFSTFHSLTSSDFAMSQLLGASALLNPDPVAEIIDAVENLRARALAARHAFLVKEFLLEARNEGLTIQTTLERNLVILEPGGGKTLVMPAIGVPDSERYQAVVNIRQRDSTLGHTYSSSPVLLYDQTGIRSRWISHLNWLNENLNCARSVSIQDARAWLQTVKAGGH